MDKLRSKQLWLGQGLPTADFLELYEDSDWQDVIDQLGKVFVKPVAEGSSIGMTPAANAEALAVAYRTAAQHGQRVLAERFIAGPEYTISILGEQPLPVIRLVPAGEFYDYEAKYLSDDTRYFIPCGLTEDEERALGALALRAFRALDCGIWGRIDVMRDAAGNFMLLEGNTIPGILKDLVDDRPKYLEACVKAIVKEASFEGDDDIRTWFDNECTDGQKKMMLDDLEIGAAAAIRGIDATYGAGKMSDSGRAAKASIKQLDLETDTERKDFEDKVVGVDSQIDFWEVLKARATYMKNPAKGDKLLKTLKKRHKAQVKKRRRRR
jgi:hypothetical protein